jgi:LysM repeat protein
MSPQTGSWNTALITSFVFAVGVGLGVGWKLGYIPIQYGPAPAGALEETDQAAADDATGIASDDFLAARKKHEAPQWAEDQGEPPVEIGINHKDEPPQRTSAPEWEADAAPVKRPPKLATRPQPRRLRDVPDDAVRQAKFQTEDDEKTPAPREPKLAFDDPVEKPAQKSADRFAEIDEKLAAGEFLAAHKLLSKLYWNSKGNDAELQERLDGTARKIFFSPQPHFIEPYVVQSGDQLRKIAGKYNLSWEYLAALNKTDPRRIREGQKLKVLKGPFAAIVNLHEFALTVHLQGYYVKRYHVGIGKDGSSPIGKFPVLNKVENPQYTGPDGKVIEPNDPKNPLGERWIDLGDSYGIHGTIEPDSIGKAASRGCIRLRDADIIEVYNFLVNGSVVEIRE